MKPPRPIWDEFRLLSDLVYDTTTWTKEDLDQHPLTQTIDFGKFDAILAHVETFWRTHYRPFEPPPAQWSLAWYAQQIVPSIETVRRTVHQYPELEHEFIAALRLGSALASAKWHHNYGKSTKVGVDRRKRSRRSGKKSGESRQQKARPRQERIRAAYDAFRKREPYHLRDSSTRHICRELHRELRIPTSTIRDTLKKLALK